jgi:hypothetical protein
MENKIIATVNPTNDGYIESFTVAGVVYPVWELLEQTPEQLHGSDAIWGVELALVSAVLAVSGATHVMDDCYVTEGKLVTSAAYLARIAR